MTRSDLRLFVPSFFTFYALPSITASPLQPISLKNTGAPREIPCRNHFCHAAGFRVLLATTFIQTQQGKPSELTLEELMSIKVEVVSASKKTEVLSQAPAAIFVLTAEDIRRGGFSSIPEALRMVPGLYVAKVNQRWWTISARGFSDYLNNKMLVLVDGRSVYTPQFGGVYWDIQDLPLEDVERIEVIRGPGGTLWGDNAVNGVINITTKHSRDTQGVSVVTSAGINEGYVASLRYGGKFTDGL